MNKYSFLLQKKLSSLFDSNQDFLFTSQKEKLPFFALFENELNDDFCLQQVKSISKEKMSAFIQSLPEKEYKNFLNLLIDKYYPQSFQYLYSFRNLDFPNQELFYTKELEEIDSEPHIHAFINQKHISFFIEDIGNYTNVSFQQLMFQYCLSNYEPDLLEKFLDNKTLSLTCYKVETKSSDSLLNFLDDFFIFTNEDYLDEEKSAKINQFIDIVVHEYVSKNYSLHSKKMYEHYDVQIEDSGINPKTMSLFYAKLWKETSSNFLICHIKDKYDDEVRYCFNCHASSEESIKNNYLEQRLMKEIFVNSRNSDFISDYLKNYPFRATSDYIYYDKDVWNEDERSFFFFHEKIIHHPIIMKGFNYKKEVYPEFCGFYTDYLQQSLALAAISYQHIELLENVCKNAMELPLNEKIISTCAYRQEIPLEFFEENKNLIKKLCRKPFVNLYNTEKSFFTPLWLIDDHKPKENYIKKMTSEFLHYNNTYFLFKKSHQNFYGDSFEFDICELEKVGISEDAVIEGFNLMEKEFDEVSQKPGLFEMNRTLSQSFSSYEKNIIESSISTDKYKKSISKKRL